MSARKPCTDEGESLEWRFQRPCHFIIAFPCWAVMICFAGSNFCFFFTFLVEFYYPLQTNEFCLYSTFETRFAH